MAIYRVTFEQIDECYYDVEATGQIKAISKAIAKWREDNEHPTTESCYEVAEGDAI